VERWRRRLDQCAGECRLFLFERLQLVSRGATQDTVLDRLND
jgi:hypothetical protein